MRNKILLSGIIILLACIVIILITKEEKIPWLDNVESITIYSIDAQTGIDYDIKELSQAAFTTIDNPKDYFSKITYKNEMVLWKGDKFGIIHMKDGSELKIRISNYGVFFSIIGQDGYYIYEKTQK